MKKMTNFWDRFVQFITFVNLPIRKKFLLFEVGVFFWLMVIGVLSVGSLSFIHYRYAQISNATVPYMKVLQKIESELEILSRMVAMHQEGLVSMKGSLGVKTSITHVKNMIAEVFITVQQQPSDGNIFEMVLRSLSKEDADSFNALQELSQEMHALEELFLLGEKKQDALAWDKIATHITMLQTKTTLFSTSVNERYKAYSTQVNTAIRVAINTIALVILFSVTLLLFFTHWLKDAFSRPIDAIIQQIHSISTGEVDLSKKLKIKSHDEIGTLSREFNKLVDTVYGVTVFKKVIEEDSSLEVVYTRLGEVFEKEANMHEYRIFDVNAAKGTMNVVHPLITDEHKFLACNEEILHNCTLCRAQKTGHKVSSFEYEGVCKEFMSEDGKKHVCIPLITSGHAGAVVQFVFDKTESADDIARINEKIFKAESYIKNSLSVIETKRLMNTLRESSLVDGLTGLYNRRFLQDHSNQIIASTLRRKKQISLLMCDMDYFKQVNDKYGHDVGDSVLKETSHILKKCVRESDIVIRFGGEEFLILLIDTEIGYGMSVAEKIRVSVEEYSFKTTDGILKKTISMGLSDFPNDTDGFWQAIKFADVALYKAKDMGRNRCIQFNSDFWDQKASF